ncbi:hypothetical protein [Agromyces subbeticus]|uniref:hypothetical protein n=1 Tax=Agromyces subbeticus TaxID=293890 RepID=UPI0003B55BC1|nr:hypothetical protein [Agromyces subbeticus]
MSGPQRQPAGQPIGGQFATSHRSESGPGLTQLEGAGLRDRFEWADDEMIARIADDKPSAWVAEPPLEWEANYDAGDPIPCSRCGGILRSGWPGVPGKWAHDDDDVNCWDVVTAARAAVQAHRDVERALSADAADAAERLARQMTCAARELARDPKAADRVGGTFTVLNQMVRVQDGRVTAEHLGKLIETHRGINAGAWGDLNEGARRELWVSIGDQAAVDASERGLDSSDLDLARPLDAILDARSDELRQENLGAVRTDAVLILLEAGKAVANRHLVGDPRFPRWTQEAYEHMVRPYQVVFGTVHPADSQRPSSWEKRPVLLASAK